MWRRLLRSGVAALAAVTFVHIEYDPLGNDDGREWVEIENTGAEPADLAGFRFLEGGVRHKLTPLGTSVILPGARAVIADSAETYRAEHPEYAGLLFDSSFSLKNTGETLALLNASGTEVASLTYTPAPKPAPLPAKPQAVGVERNPEPVVPSTEEPAPAEPLTAAVAESLPAATQGGQGVLPWLMGLAAVIGVGVAALFVARPKGSSGYTILEDKQQ